MDNKEQLKKELMRYSKAEIVGALLDVFGGDQTASNMLRIMHKRKSDALFKESEKAVNRAKDAWDAYTAWVNWKPCSKMSSKELEKTIVLKREAEKASDERDRMMKRVERFFREGT